MKNQNEPLVSLGRTDVMVSPVGAGTNSWGARRRADPAKKATFDALLDAGINFFDTAEIYTMGASERTIGLCARESTAPASPVVLTKFFPMPWRLGKAALPAALRRSLGRLGLPKVDVYLLHFPSPPVALAVQTRRAHAALAARGVPLACNEVELSLLKRAPERTGLAYACRDLGVTLIAYRPLAMGMLTGKYTPEHPPAGIRSLLFGRRYLAALQPLLGAMKRAGEAHGGKSASQVAINWVMRKDALPIPGAKDERQARENAGAMGWRLTASEIAELEALADKAAHGT